MFTRKFERRIYIFLAVVALSVTWGFAFGVYALWPANVETGYEPDQPIAYSHRLHAGELQIDCQYCHSNVQTGAHADISSVANCMKCHTQVQTKGADGRIKPEIAKLLEHWETRTPIRWVFVHNLADFVYFDHSRHINADLDCQECHGQVELMERVQQVYPLTMGWCLECHRKAPPPGYPDRPESYPQGRDTWAPTHCYACHR